MTAFSTAFAPGAFAAAAVGPAPDTTAPAWPSGAEIGISGLTSAGYTATAPTATDANGVTAYRWTLGGSVLSGVTGTTYTRTGGTPSGTDALTVVALDAAGNVSAALSKSVTLQAAPDIDPPEQPDMITNAQAAAYLLSLGVDVPADMLADALETVAAAVPAMQAAGYSGPTMRRIQRMAVALVAAPGGPRRVQSQAAPSGASRSFKYADADFSALRRSLRALDTAGTVAQIVGPDPVAIALLIVV